MERYHLVEQLLREIANARAGITASYARLWRAEAVVDTDSPPDANDGDPQEPKSPRPSAHDG